jgi:hypothetical protein
VFFLLSALFFLLLKKDFLNLKVCPWGPRACGGWVFAVFAGVFSEKLASKIFQGMVQYSCGEQTAKNTQEGRR